MQLHALSLHRLMRTLASLGVLTERDEQRFALTPLGEALKTGAPGSARATADRVWRHVLARLGRNLVFPGDGEDRL
jgi:DNA-binding IclR family transcriptional regulator